jgi:crotonobetainyl-CoA:carnitine CoA-transferase CaiB-like acyl-CoA transferase
MTEVTTDPADLPLRGLVVADFSRVLAGPLTTMVLADLGADVVKVERPGTGDDTRGWGPPFAGEDAAYYLSVNRNKRSVLLDLGDPGDRELARALCAGADVLVENFRPGVMASFSLDYPTLRDLNPRLVYCSIPAFAHESRREAPGYDLLMQAMAGYMSFTGEPGGEPVKVGVALLDVVAGLYAAVGILGALLARGEDGPGRQIEVGLFEASVAGLVNQAAGYLAGGGVPRAAGTAHPSIVPYQMFAASDGHFVLAAGNDKLFAAVCRVVGRSDLAEDARFVTNAGRVTHRVELVAALGEAFERRTASEWIRAFTAAGVPAAPVRDLEGVFTSPEGEAMISEVPDPVRGLLRLVRSPLEGIGLDPDDYTPPPTLGEHDAEIREGLAGS